MKRTLTILLLAIALVGCGNASHTAQPDYSYKAFYHEYFISWRGNPPIAACTFVKHSYQDINLTDNHTFTNYFYTCEETGKNPTVQQQNVWLDYVLWHDCKQGSQLACDADVSE